MVSFTVYDRSYTPVRKVEKISIGKAIRTLMDIKGRPRRRNLKL